MSTRTRSYIRIDGRLGEAFLALEGDRVVESWLPGDRAPHGVRTAARDVADAVAPVESDPAAPLWVRELAADVRSYLDREPVDLSRWSHHLDLDRTPPFFRRVYRALLSVGPGETITYGELAARAGRPGGARAVGQAMARNPLPLLVPCHRVIASQGIGGFGGGLELKRRLLAAEGSRHGRSDLPPP